MLGIFLSLAASAQAQPTTQTASPAPPPPPILRTNSPPPPIVSVNTPPPMIAAPPAPPPYYPGDRSSPPATLELRVAAEGRVLWEDVMRVGPQGGASVAQNRSEAPAEGCAPITSYPRSTATSFRINIQPAGSDESRALYNVDVNWSRPGSGDGCIQGGNRAVSLQQPVELSRGQEVTLRGDGGLTVRIRRR